MKSKGLHSLNINEVKLDINNPRIKQYLEIYQGEITGLHIALALQGGGGDATNAYIALRDAIKESQGIIHPIVVSEEEDGTYVVIEGNTRLQIYKDFDKAMPNSIWATIPSIVYAGLTEYDKHKIRLQSHLVGPRDWDAYSKAKYLYQLSEIEFMPMNSIIALCGGKKKDITKAIEAYKHMLMYYEPEVKAQGMDPDIKEYSKFAEYQGYKKQLYAKGCTEDVFAKWVVEGNIDNAMKVRILPAVIANSEAFSVFKKKNLTAAEKILAAATVKDQDINLDNVPFETLCKKICDELPKFGWKEIQAIANDDSKANLKDIIFTLQADISEFADYIKNQEV